MADIYNEFDKATRDVTAVVLILDGKPVGRIVIRNLGNCTAYVHIWGTEMAKGTAYGHGYDRVSAAVDAGISLAYSKYVNSADKYDPETVRAMMKLWNAFGAETERNRDWRALLEDAGFVVALAI